MTDYLKRATDYRQVEIASAFDELSFWSSRFGHLLFKHMELRGAVRVLDLGFGTGFPMIELAHTLGPTSRITGLDLWREAMARARLKLKTYALSNVTMAEGDGSRQPFAD